MDELTRQLVCRRAGNRCEYCGRHQSQSLLAALHIEHILPRKHHGGDDPANLALACVDCNLHKGTNVAGYSYLGHDKDQEMKAYFTLENTVAFLQQCERHGITTHQFSAAAREAEVFRKLREQGLKLQLIGLYSKPQEAKTVAETIRPIAMAHHGGVTDRLFRECNHGTLAALAEHGGNTMPTPSMV